MNDNSSTETIILILLIVVILVIILCTQLGVVFPGTQPATGQSRRSLRHAELQPEVPEEEEPLLSLAGVRDTSFGQGAETQRTEDIHAHLAVEVDRWKDANTTQAEEIAKLQQDLSTSVFENSELQRRCETLSRDLEGARLFLNTADTFADSEVIQLLQKLNTELQHTSTFMVDHVVEAFKLDAVTSHTKQKVAMDRALDSIGSPLLQFLRTANCDDPELPMYLQIAFQAYLTHRMYWIVSSWTLDEGCSTRINEIYQRMRESESQTISGRWRCLTRSYALPTCVSEPDALVVPVIAGLSHVLLAAGCAATQSEVMSELSSMFEKKILAAITLAARLNQMIGGVVSGDFEVFVAHPSDTFHEGTMAQTLDDDVQGVLSGTGSVQTVLCTTELGLMKRIQRGMGEWETTTAIKAKVILESFLDAENQ